MAGWWSAGRTTRCLRPADCTAASTTCSFVPDMLSGFTIVRNAVSLDYPIVPALRSILAICDEVVVNVGRSSDGTRDLVAGLGDPRVRVIDTVWDFSRGSGVLAQETERAMRACRGTWGLYIQADEVLHETGAAILQERLQAWDGEPRVEGLLVDYRHFYGDFDTVATNRHWYRREVRCVRLDRDIHPRVAQEWIAARRHLHGDAIGPRRFRLSDLRYYVSDWIEQLTGVRVFEYRNYVEV